jgi:hypothetical protein
MFEANANYEFTVTIGREIQSEIIAMGRPSPAKLLNAMSNPQTLESLMQVGLVPQGTVLLEQKDIMLQLSNQPTTVVEPVKELENTAPKKKIKRTK